MNITEEHLDELRKLKGSVFTCNITGMVTAQTFKCWSDMRSWCDRNGFHNIEWETIHLVLVDKARDLAFAHSLKHQYDFCLQIDGDATFPPDTFIRLMYRAYIEAPQYDVVGAYAQLKGQPYRPTVDTGSGTWENFYPEQGLVSVVRTGGHLFLTKTPILRRFGPPWFQPDTKGTPSEALAALDNYSRMNFDGVNKLGQTPEWEEIVDHVSSQDKAAERAYTGEDSSFFDRLLAAGGRAAVDTDLVSGHVTTKVIMPQDFKDEIDKEFEVLRAGLGVYS